MKVTCDDCKVLVPQEDSYEQDRDGTLVILCGDCLVDDAPFRFYCLEVEDYVNNNYDCDDCEFYKDCDERRNYQIPC